MYRSFTLLQNLTTTRRVVKGIPEASFQPRFGIDLPSCTSIVYTSCTSFVVCPRLIWHRFHRPQPCSISSQYQRIGEPSHRVQAYESERRRQCKAFDSAYMVKVILLWRPSMFGRRFYATLESKLTSTGTVLGM